jgi:hypothetical protein
LVTVGAVREQNPGKDTCLLLSVTKGHLFTISRVTGILFFAPAQLLAKEGSVGSRGVLMKFSKVCWAGQKDVSRYRGPVPANRNRKLRAAWRMGI